MQDPEHLLSSYVLPTLCLFIYILPEHFLQNFIHFIRKYIWSNTAFLTFLFTFSFEIQRFRRSVDYIACLSKTKDFIHVCGINLLSIILFQQNCIPMVPVGSNLNIWLQLILFCSNSDLSLIIIAWYDNNKSMIIGGSREREGPSPSEPEFLHFHAIFGKNWSNSMLAPPPPSGLAPPLWEILFIVVHTFFTNNWSSQISFILKI